MKITTILIDLILFSACSFASLRIGYNTGRADGWQVAGNDVQTVIDYRQRVTILGAKATPEATAAAWNAARVAGADRDRAWFEKGRWERISEANRTRPQEIWRRPEFPAELVPSVRVNVGAGQVGRLELFPFSSIEVGKAKE